MSMVASKWALSSLGYVLKDLILSATDHLCKLRLWQHDHNFRRHVFHLACVPDACVVRIWLCVHDCMQIYLFFVQG